MRAPGFWFTPPERPALAARALAPLAALTARATARRVARAPDLRAAVPVICVGNLNAGGTGKTPTTMALLMRLAARGRKPWCCHAAMAGRWPGRCGSIRNAMARRMSATSRCCWRPSRRWWWRATGPRGRGWRSPKAPMCW